jgi:putative membrane protein
LCRCHRHPGLSLLYAAVPQPTCGGFRGDIRAPVEEIRRGAQIMKYGCDIAELLLAALMAT